MRGGFGSSLLPLKLPHSLPRGERFSFLLTDQCGSTFALGFLSALLRFQLDLALAGLRRFLPALFFKAERFEFLRAAHSGFLLPLSGFFTFFLQRQCDGLLTCRFLRLSAGFDFFFQQEACRIFFFALLRISRSLRQSFLFSFPFGFLPLLQRERVSLTSSFFLRLPLCFLFERLLAGERFLLPDRFPLPGLLRSGGFCALLLRPLLFR